MKRLKLGILQVNRDRSIEVGDAFPDDAHRFRDLFDAQNQRFTYRVYMTIGGEVPQDVEEQDAYLITGSPLSVLDDLAFLEPLYAFIRACDAAKKPLMGVCFGHQAIAEALGGNVERTAWNVGVETVPYGTARSFMASASPPTLKLYTFHHDAVTRMAPGFESLASTEGAEFASTAKGDHIFTIQSHPEFTDPFMRCVLDYTRPHLDAGTYTKAKASLLAQADGDVFAAWMTRFFGGTP